MIVCLGRHSHSPSTHIVPDAQILPHRPQFGLKRRSTQDPLQRARFGPVHFRQAPEQYSSPLQRWPHDPQLFGSRTVSRQVPSQYVPKHTQT